MQLPNGVFGFIEANGLQLLVPLKSYELTKTLELLDAPEAMAPKVAELKPGEKIQLLGKFGDYSLLKKNELVQGWIKM